jgi:hypothetical protein
MIMIEQLPIEDVDPQHVKGTKLPQKVAGTRISM